MPPADAAPWTLRCTHHGLVATSPDGQMVDIPRSPTAPSRSVLAGEPPIALQLRADQIEEIGTETLPDVPLRATAATAFGPDGQDNKVQNEDFAVASCAMRACGEPWAIAALADGVSAKTFWGGRASRIAGLVAWQVVCEWLDVHGGPTRPPDAAIRELISTLTDEVVQAYLRDQVVLRVAGTTPGRWSPAAYSRFRERDALWFNTSLQIGMLGLRWGLVLHCGGGGIRVTRPSSGDRPTTQTLLRTHGDGRPRPHLSLDPSTADFKPTWIADKAGLEGGNDAAVTIAMATDGVENTWRRMRAGTHDLGPFRPLSADVGPHAAALRINHLLRHEHVDTDNHSLALLQRSFAGQASQVPAPVDAVEPGRYRESPSTEPPPAEPRPVEPTPAETVAATEDWTTEPRGNPEPTNWLDRIPAKYQYVARHLSEHGRLNHGELRELLGSEKEARRFTRFLDELPEDCPFQVRVKSTDFGKVYLAEPRN